ncbi:hypothetical protein Krac_12396 [Ktedonobacter racemifer DSM 44963]|uniref:Uncharacterized protein n=1 Tax=Ktedonobacter racemifer DSM 44963 TaxID=485913 RepID=D6TGP9_KTERA|nr:hypothetical protein Krac_12396 [Ktedonobacter racemifer DSM 44963]
MCAAESQHCKNSALQFSSCFRLSSLCDPLSKEDRENCQSRFLSSLLLSATGAKGIGSFTSAARFCRAFDEVRQFFRICAAIAAIKESVFLSQQRERVRQRLVSLQSLVQAA